MNDNFSKAFEMLTEGFKEIGKGIETLAEDLTSNVFTEREAEGTKIKIKKGSIVLVGKGTYAKLCQDVEAELVEQKEEKKEN